MAAAKETGFFRGAGGTVFEMDLPLTEVMQNQLSRRELTRVANAEGDPYDEQGTASEPRVPVAPAKNASKADWVAYALKVDPELTADDADAMTRDDLVEMYGSK